VIKLTIDEKIVEVSDGTTILNAARQAGIDIPTLCYCDKITPPVSCFVCVVKIHGRDNFMPSCATIAQDGMIIDTNSDEVRECRKHALDLMLSMHAGDCDAPCTRICPYGLNVPEMIRRLLAGDIDGAGEIVSGCMPFSATREDACPAHCQKGCRVGLPIQKIHSVIAEKTKHLYIREDNPSKYGKQRKRKEFSMNIGRLSPTEIESLAQSIPYVNKEILSAIINDDDIRAIINMSAKCLQCNCGKKSACKLRDYATQYGARHLRYSDGKRNVYERKVYDSGLVHEPGKCITCGKCVNITKARGIKPGLALCGRGSNVYVAAPFGADIDMAMGDALDECVRECPTGAMWMQCGGIPLPGAK
jgi:predicted molibdopterin-dependent oxidoreductase YjgC